MASKRSLGGGIKIPSGGGSIPNYGGNNALMNMMMAQNMLPQKESIKNEAEIRKQKELSTTAIPQSKDIVEQMGGATNVPRDASFRQGGVEFSLNPRLNADERGDVASMNVLEPHFKNIIRMIDEGFLESPQMGNFGRTVKEGVIDIGQPLLTTGNDRLQQIQGEFNRLKSKLPFDSGGKQLTGTEKSLVFKLFNITGKSNETIKDDLNFAMDLIRARAKLAVGGANSEQQISPTMSVNQVSKSPIPGMNQPQDDESRKEKLRQIFLKK